MTAINDNHVSFSYLSGSKFTFEIGDTTIKLYASAWSGKETVFINGNVVSESRSHSLSTSHEFEYEGSSYKIELTMGKLIGTFRCSLQINEVFIKAYILKHDGNIKHIRLYYIISGIMFYFIFTRFSDYLIFTIPIFILVIIVLNRLIGNLAYEIELGDQNISAVLNRLTT